MEFKETIFLTGFPGFIAERLVERLAAQHRQQLLLVQSSFVQASIQRIEGISERTGVPLENFALIEGDITWHGLGIPSEDAELVRETAAHVFHVAAVYDLKVSREVALAVNLEGTRNVNALVKAMPDLKRYSYV